MTKTGKDKEKNMHKQTPHTIVVVLGMLLVTSVAWAGSPEPLPPADAAGQTEAVVTPYPLKTCLVSGEALGSMGPPVRLVHENQEILFCCKGCLKDFNKDPKKLMDKLAAAAATKKAEAAAAVTPDTQAEHSH